MPSPEVLSEIRGDGIAVVTMSRPEIHNAFDDAMIATLTATLSGLGDDPAVRAVVLRGAGKSFSAGADLGWMRRMARYSHAENEADALALAELMRTLDRLPKPTVAAVHGAALGGGVGLVACCDVAIAAEAASFALSEVRLGLIPAVISPYVVAAMGQRAARRMFLTAERFDARTALRFGLVHEVVAAEALDAAVEAVLARLLEGGPAAQAAAKDLIFAVAQRPVDEDVLRDTARRIADQRASPEGREGVSAFLEKREPSWRGPG
ncbi:enoyl-CoA hydratase-related protein [Arenibaculum pallidiluteum]|uniref:enoyl-CoA hydratase-related protein n=1 Tax=Arenibaculum pallidiluteum TaxID=2812559 RepID=UPI001A965904|nr:enoyl-CoA hydratase-related protein [Arenibaculum pallidiluteum]